MLSSDVVSVCDPAEETFSFVDSVEGNSLIWLRLTAGAIAGVSSQYRTNVSSTLH